jgi:hypothetical protein
VQDAKVGKAHGKFTVTTLAVSKENKVARAVHGLKGPIPLLDIKLEHIILVVSPVTGSLPDANVVHVGSLDLLVATLAILGAQERLELVEDLDSVREEEGTTGGHFIKKEKLLLLTYFNVITLIGFLQEMQVLSH